MVRININCLHLRDLGVDAESSRCHGEEKPGSVCLACHWSPHVSSSSFFFFTLLQCLVFENIPPFLLLGCGAHCHFASRILWTKSLEIPMDCPSFMFMLLFFLRAFFRRGEGYRDQEWWLCDLGAGKDDRAGRGASTSQ